MVFGVFFGTIETLKMSISSRRNTHFHVFDPRKYDLEIGPRKSWKKVRFGMHFGLNFGDFWLQKRVQKSGLKKVRKKVRKKPIYPFLGFGPAECAVAGERLERGPERQNCRILGKIIWKGFLKFEIGSRHSSLARSSLPYGQGGGFN